MRIKQLREKAQLTQQQIADALGISRTTLTRYENGTREPDIQTLIKIAKFFNVTVDYLTEADNYPLEPKTDLNKTKMGNVSSSKADYELSKEEIIQLKLFLKKQKQENTEIDLSDDNKNL